MTVFKLINTVRAKGVKLWQENGQLKIKAPKGSVTSDILEELKANKQEILDFLQHQSQRMQAPPLVPADRASFEYLPLSYAQERLWFIDQLEPNSVRYNTPMAATFRGGLDLDRMQKAFDVIIERHENLRTIFPNRKGKAHQTILKKIDFKIEYTDLNHFTEQERMVKARQLCQAEAETPFNIAVGPLIRVKLITLKPDEHVVMLNMHHIVSDGWSHGVLLNELGLVMDALAQGKQASLMPLPIQYADYSVWQRNWLEKEGVLEDQLDYWQEKLSGLAETSTISLDHSRPATQSFTGADFQFKLDKQVSKKLKSLSEQKEATLFMTLLAVFNVLFYRYTGQEDICLGSPIANRKYAETQNLVGMFANTLVLRNIVDSDDSFLSFLEKVKTTCLDAYQYQDVPFEKIVERVQPQRDLSITPLFQIMLALQDAPLNESSQSMEVYPIDSGISKYDLTIEFSDSVDEICGLIQYSTDLYQSESIKRLGKHFAAFCQAITTDPTAKICDLEYLDEDEVTQLLTTFNQSEADYPKTQCIHQLIDQQCAIDPEKIAVVHEDDELSYQQLYDETQNLALYLQKKGVGVENIVGLCVDRSLSMLIGTLGILKSGGAFLPVDPNYPEARLGYMMDDCDVKIVLTQEKYKDKLGKVVADDIELVFLDNLEGELTDNLSDSSDKNDQLVQVVQPHNLAYVIYTSGSTGKPKGVMTEHYAAINCMMSVAKRPGLSQQDRLLSVSTNCFDMSIVDYFLPLAIGAQLFICSEEEKRDAEKLKHRIHTSQATFMAATPASWQLLFQSGWKNSEKVKISCGGEALTETLIKYFDDTGTDAWNCYGPTEATVYTTFWKITDHRPISLGAAVDNKLLYVLDSNLKLLPIGVQGELHIGGDGLSRGYINQSELTDEKFIDSPFCPGTKIYKSGDLVRWLADGSLEFVGRVDTQVKVRGFRIETGEIEANLDSIPEIESSVVMVQERNGVNELVVYYQRIEGSSKDSDELSIHKIKAHLTQSLPDFMVPEIYVPVDQFRLTSSGKIDRKDLEKIEVKVQSHQTYVAPGTATEKQLTQVCAQLLSIDQKDIGINDSFFELGGNSLLAARLAGEVRTAWEVTVPIKEIFFAPQIKELAKFVDAMIELKTAHTEHFVEEAETVDEGLI